MASPFQPLAETLDLTAALRTGAAPSDLVPTRPEDAVAGNVGNRFLGDLVRAIARGWYDPSPAYFVSVPKSSHATRPAAVLNLADRVMYSALVLSFQQRIEESLLGNQIVFWPRGIPTKTSWREFEHSPLAAEPEYVVVADVSAFYESIDHEILADRLVRITGRRAEAEALLELLNRTMQAKRGLPQGLPASDYLATAYISPVDNDMTREGFSYSRHGDDMRMAASNYDAARHAILSLERSIRAAGLQLNGVKSRILKQRTYGEKLKSIEDFFAATKRALHSSRLERLQQDSAALAEALKTSDNDELGWDLFYHGSVTLTEVIERLRPHLEPDDRHVAERLFEATMDAAPGTARPLEGDAFHQQLTASLVRLAATESPIALPRIGKLITEFPEKTGQLCSYLSALAPSRPKEVWEQISIALDGKAYRTEWEAAVLIRSLSKVSEQVSEELMARLGEVIARPHGRFLHAVEGAKLLAVRGKLQQRDLGSLWNSCPKVFRSDLVVAAGTLADKFSWADAFFKSSRDDPILRAVASQIEEQRTGQSGATPKSAGFKHAANPQPRR